MRTACASSPPATTRTSPIRPARRSSSCPATCSSPRRRSACRCSATAIPSGEIAKLLHSVALFPERAHLVGAYSLGKAQRVIALIRKAGYDEPIYLHGAMEKHHALLREPRHRARRTARRCAAPRRRELAGAIALCPPSALKELWSRRFPDPVTCLRVGLDAGARARAPARRRAAAGDLRPRRLGRAHRDHRRDRRVGGLGHARPGGCAGALVRDARPQGAAARHRRLRRRGRDRRRRRRPSRRRATAHEPLRRTARPPRLRARPQQQAAADDRLFPQRRPIPSAALRSRR